MTSQIHEAPQPTNDTAASSADEEAFRVAESANFNEHLETVGLEPLRRAKVTCLQVNIGKRCNLACHHCHVESGPNRTEMLSREGVERVIVLLEQNQQIDTLDLTGGAPELHPDFRDLVRAARGLNRRVIDRCNLTIFNEPGQEDTPAFLADQGVDIVASLPCYSRKNVEAQRGKGTFGDSIEALRTLNTLGYGRALPGHDPLVLDLIYNPVGAFLPPNQAELEATYREELHRLFGIEFRHLLTITNMPIKRFAHTLARERELDPYMSRLVDAFNPQTVDGLMCRSLISVDYEGRLFDCDFNQALDLRPPEGTPTIFELEDLSLFEERPISTGAHCFGCTAGAGSSCGGAISS